MKYPGGFAVWTESFVCLRIPRLFNLRMDPFESADIVSDQYDDWRSKNSFLVMYVNCRAMAFLKTFAGYPPSQESQSFTITQAQPDIEVQIKAAAGK
jgi:arylsulfatase